MTAKQRKIGDLIEVKERGTVVRPDGSETVVTGGSYVLAEAGTYTVDGSEVNVE